MPAAFALAAVVAAQTDFLPLKQIKPGMHGIGKTVFSGDRIDDFQVEILGVLENIGPKQSLILGRLSGGPLERAGVLQGMSGSPVYINGKLAGAVAMAFPFAKEPIAGIRPIEEMLRVRDSEADRRSTNPKRTAAALTSTDLTQLLPVREETFAGGSRMIDIATPVSFSGFTHHSLEQFGASLRALGLEPLQGISGGGRVTQLGDPSKLKPGSMISVQLMTGDMSIGADGTVTYIDGDKIYAFGHRFLSVGATALPFARAEVLTLLPTLGSSFKISSQKEEMGTISQDRNTAVFGQLGRRAAMVPISVSVGRSGHPLARYQMQMVNERFLSPVLVQMAVFSAIDATERTVGAASYRVTGEIDFEGLREPVKLNNMFAGDNGSAIQVSLSAAIPLAYVLQSGFEALQIKKVALEIESYDEKKLLQIDQVLASPREVRAGDKLDLTVVLVGENGAELIRKIHYRVPPGALPGPLFFTVADGITTNLAEFQQILGKTPRSAGQLVSTVNSLRANTKAYVRVWRQELAYQLEGEDFPDPPASVALILSGTQNSHGGISQTRNSKLGELEIDAGDRDMVISGLKTIQVEVKE